MDNKPIIEYLPEFIRRYKEIQSITSAEQDEINLIWIAFKKSLDNAFVMDADEASILHYEKIVGITSKPNESLDDRKFNLTVKINEQLPYTINTLKDNLTMLCGKDGCDVIVNSNEYSVLVKVALIAKNNFNAVEEMVKRFVPANMIVSVIQMFNSNKVLSKFQHSKLHQYTYHQLRNEVIK